MSKSEQINQLAMDIHSKVEAILTDSGETVDESAATCQRDRIYLDQIISKAEDAWKDCIRLHERRILSIEAGGMIKTDPIR